MKQVVKFLLVLLFLVPHQAKSEPWQSMELVGSGEYQYLGFISIYQARLYIESGNQRDERLDYNKCLVLDYKVSITSGQFAKAANTILGRQQSAGEMERLRPLVDLLHDSYQDVEDGDRYSLCFERDSQTTSLFLNGTRLATVPSREFASAYFDIWLGEQDPIDDELRDSLLHKTTMTEGKG